MSKQSNRFSVSTSDSELLPVALLSEDVLVMVMMIMMSSQP